MPATNLTPEQLRWAPDITMLAWPGKIGERACSRFAAVYGAADTERFKAMAIARQDGWIKDGKRLTIRFSRLHKKFYVEAKNP